MNTVTIARIPQARSIGFPMLISNQPVIYNVSGSFSERNRTSVWLEIGTALRGYFWLVYNSDRHCGSHVKKDYRPADFEIEI